MKRVDRLRRCEGGLGGLLLAVSCALTTCAWAKGPLEPADALGQFQLDAGLRIELVACEPQVIDPIAIRFDEHGRLWVVEMRDYPHGPPEGEPPLSKIRLLSDRDGDGRYETAQTFAEDLLFPTGLQPWQGGLIVTLAGEVIYLKDTDNDGRADVRETWFRGFTVGNPQLRANHPRLGHDNRVYVANGLLGGEVLEARREGGEPISISGRDFRFDPRGGSAEAISGNGQFGLTFDASGNRFVCSNRQPLDHVVLENRYLARDPLLAVPSVQTAVAPAGEASRVFPLTKAWTTSNLHAGQFTAACGIEIDRGSLLGADYLGNSFTCEPTGSLVHREILTPLGATFRGEPATPGKEFLASPDAWFRPVNLEYGPDGALYVVDMYRAVIEHPDFMPSELQKRPDLRLGVDRGRIYRILPKELPAAESVPAVQALPEPATASAAELVARLEHPHSWQRETAARLLFERQDHRAVEPLKQLVRNGSSPAARIAALWVLEGLDSNSPAVLEVALKDDQPRVREQAVALSERWLVESPALQTLVLGLATDADPRVRFRVALAVGALDSQQATDALAAIAVLRDSDIWTLRGVATARPERIAPILNAVLGNAPQETPDFDSPTCRAARELAAIVGARREPTEISALIILIGNAKETSRLPAEIALLGLGEGLARRGTSLAAYSDGLPDADELRETLDQIFEHAMLVAKDTNSPEVARLHCLELLAHARQKSVAEACLGILNGDGSQAVRAAAATALTTQCTAEIAQEMLASYGVQMPGVRGAIRDALSVLPVAAKQLLAATEQGSIAPAELGTACTNRLKNHRDEEVRALAAKILRSEVPAERHAVLADYQAALQLTPDSLGGKKLFRQHCATCHHIGDVGVDVAPDISDSRVKSQAQLLTDILHPNQAIDNNYVSYTVAMADGNVHTGLIAAETSSSVTLRQPENKTLTLLRADIEALRSSGVSLMPEGFEKHLSHQQMADLIGFVKNWRYLEQPIPGTIGDEAAEPAGSGATGANSQATE